MSTCCHGPQKPSQPSVIMGRSSSMLMTYKHECASHVWPHPALNLHERPAKEWKFFLRTQLGVSPHVSLFQPRSAPRVVGTWCHQPTNLWTPAFLLHNACQEGFCPGALTCHRWLHGRQMGVKIAGLGIESTKRLIVFAPNDIPGNLLKIISYCISTTQRNQNLKLISPDYAWQRSVF